MTVAEITHILVLTDVGHAPVEVIKASHTLERAVIQQFVKIAVCFVSFDEDVEHNPLIFVCDTHGSP
jgi:hypothetical protein